MVDAIDSYSAAERLRIIILLASNLSNIKVKVIPVQYFSSYSLVYSRSIERLVE